MPDIRIYDASNNFREITEDFLPKLQSLSIKESLTGQADSLSLSLKNNQNSYDYWALNYFDDRNFNLKIEIDGVNFGVFNIDNIEFDFNLNGDFISLNGLCAPVTTAKSIYQQIRKVWNLNTLENILREIARLADLELDYFFDKISLKMNVQNEYLFNVFVRNAEKFGAVVKIYRESESDKYRILFYGKKDIAENAALLKKSEIANTLGRGAGIISIDQENLYKNIRNINFKLVSDRKELKIVYYDPATTKTYTKTSKNKTRLYIEDSRRDFEIVKVTSKQEADIVARKVEQEPPIIGDVSSRWNPDFLTGNIIEFKNYSTLSGFYLITESRHFFTTDENGSEIVFERLPDENFDEYL